MFVTQKYLFFCSLRCSERIFITKGIAGFLAVLGTIFFTTNLTNPHESLDRRSQYFFSACRKNCYPSFVQIRVIRGRILFVLSLQKPYLCYCLRELKVGYAELTVRDCVIPSSFEHSEKTC